MVVESLNFLTLWRLRVVVRVRDNAELLKQRMQAVASSQEELDRDVQQQMELSRVYLSNINGLKPELKRLAKRREQLKK